MNDHSSERLYDRNFLIALATQTCFVGANTLMAHYARWIDFLGGSLRQVGVIMGVGALLGLVLRPWMAQWINRLGARATWAVGCAVFSVASIANLLLSETGPLIYLLRSSLVLGAAIVFASGLTYISQTAPEHRRTEGIGMLGIGGFLGMLIGPLLGDLFLVERSRGNFEWLFVVASSLSLLSIVGLYFLRPVENGGVKSSVRLSEFLAITRRYWPGTIVLVDLTFGICMAAPFIFVASFIDQANLRIAGVSIIGLFFLGYAGVGILVRVRSRRLPDRIGARPVLLAGLMIMSIGMFCFGLVDAARPWLILVPAILTGIGHSLTFHTMTSLTLQRFPTHVRGTGSALALMMLDLGMLAGAPVLGWIGDQFGFAALFGSIGTICMVSAVVYAVTSTQDQPADELLVEPTVSLARTATPEDARDRPRTVEV